MFLVIIIIRRYTIKTLNFPIKIVIPLIQLFWLPGYILVI